MTDDRTIEDPAPRRPRPWWVKIPAALLSTLVALGLAELAATWAMGASYPFLNIYVADEALGVRLEPMAVTRVESPLGRRTEVRTNALGYRGRAFPSAAEAVIPSRVLVVGDSQVMAYGVDEQDGFVPRLVGTAGSSALDVMGVGVPTWGPAEYVAVASELLATYRPGVLVVVLNAANDWNEADHPNRERTTARDGWAVGLVPGVELEPPTAFPGRHFLLSRSHLVLAARLLLHGDPHTRSPPPVRLLVAQAPTLIAPRPPFLTRLGPHLDALHRRCVDSGCRLLTVYLPTDVEVDQAEWAKYLAPGEALADLATPGAAALLSRLRQSLLAEADALARRSARRRGEGDSQSSTPPLVLDLLPTLAAASPGAFLPDDFHLSPRGHEAVAAALAPVLRELVGLGPPRLAQPTTPTTLPGEDTP